MVRFGGKVRRRCWVRCVEGAVRSLALSCHHRVNNGCAMTGIMNVQGARVLTTRAVRRWTSHDPQQNRPKRRSVPNLLTSGLVISPFNRVVGAEPLIVFQAYSLA